MGKGTFAAEKREAEAGRPRMGGGFVFQRGGRTEGQSTKKPAAADRRAGGPCHAFRRIQPGEFAPGRAWSCPKNIFAIPKVFLLKNREASDIIGL